jgi:hypothetical protein
VTNVFQNSWVEGLYETLDMTNIQGYPHKILSSFREWLPTFSGEDFALARPHLHNFMDAFSSYDSQEKYEDVCRPSLRLGHVTTTSTFVARIFFVAAQAHYWTMLLQKS